MARLNFEPKLFDQLTVTGALFLVVAGTGCTATQSGEGALRNSLLREEQQRRNVGDEKVPTSAEAQYLFLRGEVAANNERFEEAQSFFEQAAAVEETPAPYLRKRLAQMLIRRGRLRDALTQLEKIGPELESDPELLELQGGVLASLRDTKGAVQSYRKALAIAPREESYILLASVLAESGEQGEARKLLGELIEKSPDTVFGRYYFARILEGLGDLKGAELMYREALKRNPGGDSIRLDLARLMGLQKRFSEGVLLCEEVLRENPSSSAARSLLAQLLLGENRIDEALKELESLKSSTADASDAQLKIALIKIERRDFEGAETELRLILSRNPKHSPAKYYLGLAYSGMGRVQEALQQLQAIEEKAQFYRESRILSAYLFRSEKRFEEALSALTQAIPPESSDPRLLGILVSAQRDASRFEDAIKTTQRLIALSPTNDQLHFSLGVLLDSAGRKEESIQAVLHAIKLNPLNAAALNYLGYTYSEMNTNLTEAEKLIQRALVVEPRNGYYIDSLGWVYFKQGKIDQAVKELTEATRLVPNDAVLLEHLALVYEAQGEIQAAIEAVKKAIPFAPESDDREVSKRLDALLSRLVDTSNRTKTGSIR